MPLNEERLIDLLRETELPAPPFDLPERMLSARRRPRRLVRWAVTAGAAALGALTTVALLLQPTTSLAQVVAASVAATRVKITDTRSWARKSTTDMTGFKVVTYRNGHQWRYEVQYPGGHRSPGYGVCDGKLSMVVNRTLEGKQIALLDDAYQARTTFSAVHKLLWPGAKPVLHRNVLWNGKRVDRFDETGSYRGIDGTESLEEHIWADPRTHLPLRVQTLRDGGSWGDMWDYDYSDQPASLFKTVAPKGCPVVDLRDERRRLASKIPDGGALLVDLQGNAVLLVSQDRWKEGQGRKIKIGDLADSYAQAATMKMYERSFSWAGIGYLGGKPLGDRVDCKLGDEDLGELPVIRVSSEAVLRPFKARRGV